MVNQEILFDRKLLRQNRLRISKNFAQHNFLHHEIANRIAENVELLNREWGAMLEINGLDGYLADLLTSHHAPSSLTQSVEDLVNIKLPSQPNSRDPRPSAKDDECVERSSVPLLEGV